MYPSHVLEQWSEQALKHMPGSQHDLCVLSQNVVYRDCFV